MPSKNTAEEPAAKLIKIGKGEVLRLKIPMEIPGKAGRNPVFSGSANSYLVRSEKGRWVIIDPGFCSKSGIDAWNKVIEKLHIGPDEIEYILITHYHADHSGMAGWFSKRTNAPIYMHPEDICAYSREREDGAKDGEETVRQMKAYGMNGRMASLVESQAETRGVFVSPYEDFLPMEDGSEFPVCEGKLHVLHTPGHSDGQCVLLWPEKRFLFSADLLLPVTFAPIFLHPFGDRDPVRTFLATLRDFSSRDLDRLTVLPGHGWPFDDPAGRAKLEAEDYVKRSEWYCQKCAQGLETAWKIALELYKEIGNKRRLIAIMGESMAYMEYLTGIGRVVREARSDGLHFLA